jgi:hypothetical protein
MAEPGGHTPGQAEDAAASHEDTDAAVQDDNAEMETESGGDPGLRPGNNGSPGDVTGSDEDTGRQMADALRYTEDFAVAAMARPELMTMLRAMPGFAEALSSYEPIAETALGFPWRARHDHRTFADVAV